MIQTLKIRARRVGTALMASAVLVGAGAVEVSAAPTPPPTSAVALATVTAPAASRPSPVKTARTMTAHELHKHHLNHVNHTARKARKATTTRAATTAKHVHKAPNKTTNTAVVGTNRGAAAGQTSSSTTLRTNHERMRMRDAEQARTRTKSLPQATKASTKKARNQATKKSRAAQDTTAQKRTKATASSNGQQRMRMRDAEQARTRTKSLPQAPEVPSWADRSANALNDGLQAHGKGYKGKHRAGNPASGTPEYERLDSPKQKQLRQNSKLRKSMKQTNRAFSVGTFASGASKQWEDDSKSGKPGWEKGIRATLRGTTNVVGNGLGVASSLLTGPAAPVVAPVSGMTGTSLGDCMADKLLNNEWECGAEGGDFHRAKTEVLDFLRDDEKRAERAGRKVGRGIKKVRSALNPFD